MLVAKWGNSLAVRIPADVARAMGLKEGDAIELRQAEDGVIEISSDADRRRQAIERIRAMARPFPPDFNFDREEANSREQDFL